MEKIIMCKYHIRGIFCSKTRKMNFYLCPCEKWRIFVPMISIKWNSKFSDLLKEHSFDIYLNEKLPTKLLEFLNEGIVLKDDCYYFKSMAAEYSDTFQDKTGNEAFNNKFYIDIFCYRKKPLSYLKISISFCWRLIEKLNTFNEQFRIILTYQSDFVNIRFHKFRKSDIEYLSENIDKYENECIVIFQNF
ncbi:MAG: hypothetical protein LBN27_11015 [Prevotellaceae bacterium]|jgi:hypothetical protein|nr:hypothetical protein [Prevotellaceae bacterium]